MRKIFYLILLLALVACKGQQQTAESESVADPATESVNPEMGKNNSQSDADATAQPEVFLITPPIVSATVACRWGGRTIRPLNET